MLTHGRGYGYKLTTYYKAPSMTTTICENLFAVDYGGFVSSVAISLVSPAPAPSSALFGGGYFYTG